MPREERNQYHQRLVQMKDKSGSSSRREKVAKLTTLLRERGNITEQEVEVKSVTERKVRTGNSDGGKKGHGKVVKMTDFLEKKVSNTEQNNGPSTENDKGPVSENTIQKEISNYKSDTKVGKDWDHATPEMNVSEEREVDDDIQGYVNHGKYTDYDTKQPERQTGKDNHHMFTSRNVTSTTQKTDTIPEPTATDVDNDPNDAWEQETEEGNSSLRGKDGNADASTTINPSKNTKQTRYENSNVIVADKTTLDNETQEAVESTLSLRGEATNEDGRRTTKSNKNTKQACYVYNTNAAMDIDDDELDFTLDSDRSQSTTEITAWDYDEDKSFAANLKSRRNITDQQQQKGYKGNQSNDIQYNNPVQIKREQITRATNSMIENWNRDELSSDDKDSQSESSSMEESREDGSDIETVDTSTQTKHEGSKFVSKRKSNTRAEHYQQKRLHTMPEEAEQQPVYQVREQTSDSGDYKCNSTTNVNYTKTDASVPNMDNGLITQEVEEKIPGNKSFPPGEQTDSDFEWEQISKNIRKKTNGEKSNKHTRYQNNHKKGIKYGHKKSNINVVFSTKEAEANILHQRGATMVEEKERMNTPVKIEFNLVNSMGNFNVIKAVQCLFQKFALQDNSIRVLEHDSNNPIWEPTLEISEGSHFVEQYRMREQTFRNGNKKITIHCIIESDININRMKYTEPVKTHIMEQNIWIKPDFYSTRVVSSPGFFTLLHPKITNKQELIKELHDIIQNTIVNNNEEAVKHWRHFTDSDSPMDRQRVPNFHLENSTRKWGGVKVEVISLHCQMEDAKYVKYILSEASTQGLVSKGTFVPSGIHLMEGKEIMTRLLQEHQEFLQNVTSFQMSGISYNEMKGKEHGGIPVQQLLLKCQGVMSVEPTYQTSQRGNWILVVEKEQVNFLSSYIQEHLSQIYAGRKKN